ARFVFLDSLPRLPNGKVDRGALPPPDPGQPERGRLCILPRTPIERELAGIWAEALRLEQVSIGDNFFALGGHSLLATRVLSRVGDTLRADVPLRTLFETPTMADLALVIAEYLSADGTAGR